MTDQTGNDRYAGTTPPRKSQPMREVDAGETMLEPKQAGAQMEQQSRRADREKRREQAGEQSDRGLGYGAQDGEEMANAPDVTQGDAATRGYGDAEKARP